MPPVHLQMILILKLTDPYPVLHLQLDKSTCQAGGWSTGKFYPRIFKESLSDRALKLRFLKFLASNQNELSSSIVCLCMSYSFIVFGNVADENEIL